MKSWIFRLLGKELEAVVVTFASGPPDLVARMFEEIQSLVPDRRHILIEPTLTPAQIRAKLRRYRIGLAPVLFSGEPEYDWLRRLAFQLAPLKILAYNRRLERHHLRPGIASFLFLKGVPLDRVYLRPTWLVPWKKDRSVYPNEVREIEGRPFAANRRRIGILTPYFPYPLSHGGAVRMHALIREMAPYFDIVLLSFHGDETVDHQPMLPLCARIILVRKPRYREPRWSTVVPPEVAEFRSMPMRRAIARAQNELGIELLQVEYTFLAPYRGDILVEHDVTYTLYRQVVKRQSTLSSRWDYWRWLRFEVRWLRRYRQVVVMSDEDRREAGGSNVTVIPNGVDLARFYPEHERPGRRVLFVGSFRHFPNVVAFRFFYEQVWPSLRDSCKLIVIAGPDPALYLPDLPHEPNLELNAFIADVRPFYVEANLVIVPTLVSAGTNLKVLEALAMERAVVSTPSGCAGLGLTHGETVWIADTAEAFAEAIGYLFENSDARQAMAHRGRLHAEEHFGWSAIGRAQRSMIRKMLPAKVTLRKLTPADLDAVVAIQATAQEASQWDRQDYLIFDCEVAEVDGNIAGFLVSRNTGPETWEILNIAVDPEYRRLGIGSTLIKAELDRNRGAHFLEVRKPNAAARALYKRLGFDEVGVRPGYYENPSEPGIVMRFLS